MSQLSQLGQMGGQMLQMPMQMAQAAGAIPQAAMQMAQQVGQQIGQMAGKKGESSRYDTEEVFEWVKGRAARTQSTDNIDAKYEQARLTKLKADNEALDVALKEGSLIEAAAVADVWERLLGNFRARMLALPAALADELAVLDDPREVQAVLKVTMNQVLEELANTDVDEICPCAEENITQ